MPTPENKALARIALDAFGGKPAVTEYFSDDRQFTVDILACSERPRPGISSYRQQITARTALTCGEAKSHESLPSYSQSLTRSLMSNSGEHAPSM